MDRVLTLLRDTKFPINASRKNVSITKQTSFVLGEVNYRGQAVLNYKTRGSSRFNKKFPELYKAITDLIQGIYPEFKYTTIQVNKNVLSMPHIDKNNIGPSKIIALGDFIGGELYIEGMPFNIKNIWKSFNGKRGHWVAPFTGERYSLVFFTHTFKPPNAKLRHITVQEDGIYDKGVLIKSYNR